MNPEGCPICKDPTVDSTFGYKIDGRQIVTCKPCWGTLMQIGLEQNLGMRKKFWGRSNDPVKIQAKVSAAVLLARGLSAKTGV